MDGAEVTLSLGVVAFMYIIFGLVRAGARFRRTWHIKYDIGLVLMWGITAFTHYASAQEWRFAVRALVIAAVAMGAGHVIYHLKFKPQQQEET